MADLDWDDLRGRAADVMRSAYCPYSRFPVGAAGLVRAADGTTRVVVGCNVENVSSGLTLCAECGLVAGMHASGGGELLAVSCVGPDSAPLAPCGRCRQVLLEHGGPGLLVDSADGPVRLDILLPAAFGPADLARRDVAGEGDPR